MYLIKKILVLFYFVVLLSFSNIVYADDAAGWAWSEDEQVPLPSWSSHWTDPKWILDSVKRRSWNVQNTKLDWVSWDWVAWTLWSVRDSIGPYINWAVFIWLSISVILLIYNWLLLITWSMNDSAIWKVKTRIMYLILWIILLTWFYFVIAIITSILSNVT